MPRKSQEFETPYGRITLVDDPLHVFGSADNLRQYDQIFWLGNGVMPSRPASVHGLYFDDGRSIVLVADGGCSTIHRHSAVVVDGVVYLCVGQQLAAVGLKHANLYWVREVDTATCFGVHWVAAQQALITHGEMTIGCLSLAGDIHWRAGGRDIFTGQVRCLPEGVEAVDFNEEVYLFDYSEGSAS